MKISFVCTGNICRSAMAEGVSRKLDLNASIEIVSMGTHTKEGQPADPNAVLACEEIGVDISSHRATPVSLAALESCDYIFAMDRSHLTYLQMVAPHLNERIFLMTNFPKKRLFQRDIQDPFGHGLPLFRKIRDEIVKEVTRVLKSVH